MYTQEHLIQAIEVLGYYHTQKYIKELFGIEITKEELDAALIISNSRNSKT